MVHITYYIGKIIIRTCMKGHTVSICGTYIAFNIICLCGLLCYGTHSIPLEPYMVLHEGHRIGLFGTYI